MSKLNYSKDSIVNHAGAFRRAYEAANDRTVTDTGKETKINAQNPYVSESDIRKKILDEKYSKINAMNKTKPDPLGYIKDKYKTPIPLISEMTCRQQKDRLHMTMKLSGCSKERRKAIICRMPRFEM